MNNNQYKKFPLKKTPLNIFQDACRNTIIVKEECKNPSGSIKDRVFYYAFKKMFLTGELKEGDFLVIASSGNSAISVAVLAPYFNCIAVVFMPSSTSFERRKLLENMGVKTFYVDGGMLTTVKEAKEYANKSLHHYIDQFFDPLLLEAHEDTVKEIVEDVVSLDYFISGVGTGVTINAMGNKLRTHYKDLKIVAFEPDMMRSLSRKEYGPHPLEGVGPNFEPTNFNGVEISSIIPISKNEAFDRAIKLYSMGYSYGITTASSFVASEKLGVHGKTILIVSYDNIDKYMKVLGEYVKEKTN